MGVQLNLDFEPGLTARYRFLEDAVAATVYAHEAGVGVVAARLDMSPSELSKRLTAHLEAKAGDISNRPLRVCDMTDILVTTGNLLPIYWLIERHLKDPEAQRTEAIHKLAQILPIIENLVELSTAKKGRR